MRGDGIFRHLFFYYPSNKELQAQIGASLQQIGDLDRMNQLINQTLTTQTLVEFEKVTELLPKEARPTKL